VPTNRRVADAPAPAAGKKRRAAAATAGQPTAAEPLWLEVIGARQNNLRSVDVRIPLGAFTAVTGPSGSGKSSLIEDVLYAALAKKLHRANIVPGAHDEIRGAEHVNKVIRVDQKPLGNSPASNPATYTGVFEQIRELYSQLPEAKLRGYTARRFSFNVPGGRCEACEGEGQICIEMHFLPDVWVECDTCNCHRYNPETLAVKYHGKSIADVLEMTCGEALRLFENIPKIRRILQTLCDVGLDYLQLGQAAPTLSGGEAQRVKLAAELARPDTGQTLYLLDEPTTGLHFDDLAKLLDVLHRLVDLGNTVVVIEHNLDVVKQCDWIIDMGPEAGDGGGRVVAQGSPEAIAECGVGNAESKTRTRKSSKKKTPHSALPAPHFPSHTGAALAPVLAEGPHETRVRHDFDAEDEQRAGDLDIADVGRHTQMPWQADGRAWHTHDRVGRKGEACKWDGRILERVVDRIHELGSFSDTNWDSRTVVEITAEKKADGWFFHALTGETWLLKLKFRVAKNTFQRDALQGRFPLRTLNELDELPIYGNDPRVKCKNLRGPWQEVEMRLHALEEIDTPEFWKFIEEAVAGFQKHEEKAAVKPEDIMPWKVLGQKWHLSRKGFRPGKKVLWDLPVLEELFEMLAAAAPDGQFLWNNQMLVHYIPRGHKTPWATLYTKKTSSIELHLHGPKGRFALGRVAELGRNRELDVASPQRDTVRVKFRSVDDLHHGAFDAFLQEHLQSVEDARLATLPK
ncbi:MAG: ATP-binding cassette domain-containing protein, partial [Planctomycetales bacterium]|nr:ATP-binding cassette domain-containing protein [Planctomycetales bacterium]